MKRFTRTLAIEKLGKRILFAVDFPGDANRNGEVQFDDLAVVARNYGLSNRDWSDGDFDGDGSVTDKDFAILTQHFGQSTSELIKQVIVQGNETSDFPSVVIVSNRCSGTIVAAEYVLTADHCILDDIPSNFIVSNGTTVRAVNTFRHPEVDIAVIALGKSITDVLPAPILQTSPSVGETIEIVGFGGGGSINDGPGRDFGTKRVATEQISAVKSAQVEFVLEAAGDAMVNHGDSGGASFVWRSGVRVLAGVHSAYHCASWEACQYSDPTIPGTTGIDVRVDAFAAWINAIIGTPPPPPPGSAPVAEDDYFTIRNPYGYIQSIDVTSNDYDPDGDPIEIVAWSTPAHGQLFHSGHNFSYFPDDDFFGTDSFTYVVSDGRQSDEAVVRFEMVRRVRVRQVDGVLRIRGTDAANVIQIDEVARGLRVTADGESLGIFSNIKLIEVEAGGRDDEVRNNSSTSAIIRGNAGNDILVGGAAVDQIFGGRGDDELRGRRGDDELYGGDGVDRIDGGVGNDVGVDVKSGTTFSNIEQRRRP